MKRIFKLKAGQMIFKKIIFWYSYLVCVSEFFGVHQTYRHKITFNVLWYCNSFLNKGFKSVLELNSKN